MTPDNKRDEAIVLGALPGTMVRLAGAIMRDHGSKFLEFDCAELAVKRLKRAGKIRHNRSAKVWEKTEWGG